jgi:hypothetical protein
MYRPMQPFGGLLELERHNSFSQGRRSKRGYPHSTSLPLRLPFALLLLLCLPFPLLLSLCLPILHPFLLGLPDLLPLVAPQHHHVPLALLRVLSDRLLLQL